MKPEIKATKERFSFIFAAGLLVLTVLGCGELRRNAERDSTPDFEISADQLAKEFKESPIAADLKYTGKTLAITGRVDQKLLGTVIAFAGGQSTGGTFRAESGGDGIDRRRQAEGSQLCVRESFEFKL